MLISVSIADGSVLRSSIEVITVDTSGTKSSEAKTVLDFVELSLSTVLDFASFESFDMTKSFRKSSLTINGLVRLFFVLVGVIDGNGTLQM